jgi:integrase/recombinase XerD
MLIEVVKQKLVGILNKRKQTNPNEIHLFRETDMAGQARTLNEKELKLLLLYIATRKHAVRDRAMTLCCFYGGMRIGEVAAVRVGDVLALDGSIKPEIRLTAWQTKGKRSRVVVLSEKLRKELFNYLQHRYQTKELVALNYTEELGKPLFPTQKREGFTANTAAYHFHMMYRAAGLEGCSSHSGRRSFLTQLSAKAVPLRVMMELAGHRQAQTTMKYCDVTADMKRVAVELL